LFVFSAASAQTLYTGGGIGVSGVWSNAYAINAYGDVTGATGGTDYFSAFLYTPTGITSLGTLGGFYSLGTAINNSDEVTGYSTVYPALCCDYNESLNEPIYHAFLYSGANMKDLHTLGGNFSVGTGINASGEVVGYSTLPGDAVWHAFLYSGGAMKDLGTLGGAGYSFANAINDSGEITGSSNGHVFLYSSGQMKDLGIIGTGNAVNDSGEITGSSGDVFLYSGGATSVLGWGSGQSINNYAQIVGNFGSVTQSLIGVVIDMNSAPQGYSVGPFLYSADTGTLQLSSVMPPICPVPWFCDPYGSIYSANGINDAGQITGGGPDPSTGYPFAVLFSPETIPLAAFQAKLQITGKGERHVRLRGSFSFVPDSNGFDPVTQPVLLQLGSLPLAIRKGSFQQDSKGDYVFQGVIGTAAVDFRISPVTTTSFTFRVEGRTGRPFRVTNPARFILMIGSNKTMGTLPWK
jgi:probable HAF family extracellular repeat protein